jgi:hypothetical protein
MQYSCKQPFISCWQPPPCALHLRKCWPLKGVIHLQSPLAKLASTVDCIHLSSQRGMHTRRQPSMNDCIGAPALIDTGESFAVACRRTDRVHRRPTEVSSVWVRIVDEASDAVFEQEITVDLPANTQFLSPRLYMNTGAAAAAPYDCAGVYLETDF